MCCFFFFLLASRSEKKHTKLSWSVDLNIFSGQNVSLYDIFKFVKNIKSPKIPIGCFGN